MKKFLAILLAALLIFALIGCSAQEENEEDADGEENTEVTTENVYEDFKYDVNENGELEITGYIYEGEKIVDVKVPSEIEGRQIVGIGNAAFKAHKNISSVELPDSIEYIDEFAFAECKYLAKITLSKNLTNIGDGAFFKCGALKKIDLPASLIEIGVAAFQDCIALQNFVLPEGLLTIDKAAFRGCTALTNVTIPTTIIDLGDAAFNGCTSLVEVNLLGDVSDKDSAILKKMNDTIAAYKGEAPKTLAEADDILAEANLYLGTLSDQGAKFVWDANENQIYGAFTKAEQELLTSINKILAENDCSSLDFVASVLKAEGITLSSLNDCVKSDKFVWDAEQKVFTTVFLGDAFSGCTSNTIISVTEGTFFAAAAQAKGYITVVPASIPETVTDAKIFSNGELYFYYPKALTLNVHEAEFVSLSSDNFVLAIVSEEKDLHDDHLTWTLADIDRLYEGSDEELTDKTLEQKTSANNVKYTKFSVKSVSEGLVYTNYVITMGATTYLIQTAEATVDTAIHTMIETSFTELN